MPEFSSALLIDQFRARVRGSLLALDFDGTLAPIVSDPQLARPLPGTATVLARLAERGAQVAVVTGRDAATALRLSGLATVPGLVVAGLYGAQLWHSGTLEAPTEPPEIAALRERLPSAVASARGLWIEDKGLSLVVHARRADDPEAALAAAAPAVASLAGELRLEVHPGRHVLEVRLPGFDKAGALERLLRTGRSAPPSAVLYAGDDVGDLPAFTLMRRLRADGTLAWGVCAASDETPDLCAAADLAVDGPAGVLALLRALAA